MSDTIQWEILEDGTVSVTTDTISGQNHLSADELLDQLGDMLGGEVKRKKRKGHVHAGHGHKHGQTHTH